MYFYDTYYLSVGIDIYVYWYILQCVENIAHIMILYYTQSINKYCYLKIQQIQVEWCYLTISS